MAQKTELLFKKDFKNHIEYGWKVTNWLSS